MKKYLKMHFYLAAVLSLFSTTICHADEYVNNNNSTLMGQYLTVANKAKPAQRDLLSQVIQVRFPQNIQTIGDAINYILRLSGYSLVSAEKRSQVLRTTLTKPLPAVDRDFGPMPLREGLTTLAGPAFKLIADPLNRTINFRVKVQFIQRLKNISNANNA